MLLGFAVFFVFYIIGGMGAGDVKFAAFMGLYLGYPKTIQALYAAFLTGAVVSVMLIIGKKKRFGQTIAFGPFLIIGSVIALLYGSKILAWYYSLNNLDIKSIQSLFNL